MKFKFWPNGVIAGFLSFVIFMLGIVYLFSRQDNPLVINDYYTEDFKFMERQFKTGNLHALEGEMNISFDENRNMTLKFPADLRDKQLEGDIWFYRPSDKRMDFYMPVSTSNLITEIPGHMLAPGLWLIKLSFDDAYKSYYYEHRLKVE